MTREEAIEYLKWARPKNPYSLDRKNLQESVDMAIEALEQEHLFKDMKSKFIRRIKELDERIDELEKETQECEDAISRQAAFEQINCWIGSGEYIYANATDYLTKRIAELSSVHPVCTDGDCISRKQALYEFEQDQYHDDFCREHNIDHSISMEMVRIRLHDLPSVSTENTGRWIKRESEIVLFECSVCKDGYIDQPTCKGKPMFKYCPSCGAKMEVEE